MQTFSFTTPLMLTPYPLTLGTGLNKHSLNKWNDGIVEYWNDGRME